MSNRLRRSVIRVAAILIILLAFGSALLPLAGEIPARTVIGSLLVAAGIAELAAFAARPSHPLPAAVAAAATFLAGLRLTLDSTVDYFTILNFVTLWLVVRSASLFILGLESRQWQRGWIFFAAAVDLLLAIALLSGFQIAFLVIGIFGPTSELLATFAWVFAASFVATGILLLAIASGDAQEAGASD